MEKREEQGTYERKTLDRSVEECRGGHDGKTRWSGGGHFHINFAVYGSIPQRGVEIL